MNKIIIALGTLAVFAGLSFAQQSNNPAAAPNAAQGQDNQAQVNPAPPADIQKNRTDIKQDKADIKQDRKEIQGDKQKLADLNKQEQADLKALNAQEKTVVEALRDAASLTPEQKKIKIAEIRKDFNTQRKALKDKYQTERKATRTDIHKDRKEIRTDKRDIRKGRRDIRRDNQERKRDNQERKH